VSALLILVALLLRLLHLLHYFRLITYQLPSIQAFNYPLIFGFFSKNRFGLRVPRTLGLRGAKDLKPALFRLGRLLDLIFEHFGLL